MSSVFALREARRTVMANPARTAVAVLLVASAVALVSAATGGAVASARRSVARAIDEGAGVVVLTSKEGFEGARCDRLRSVSAVRRAATAVLRTVGAAADPGVRFPLLAATPSAIELFDPGRRAEPGRLAVGGYLADSLGLESGARLRVDDEGVRRVEVLAGRGARTSEIDRSALSPAGPDERYTTCWVELALPASRLAPLTLRALFGQPDVEAQWLTRDLPDPAAARRTLTGGPARTLPPVVGLVLGLLVLAGVGARARELAIYRSMGSSRATVLAMLVGEFLMVTTSAPAGWVVGLVLGDAAGDRVAAYAALRAVLGVVGVSGLVLVTGAAALLRSGVWRMVQSD